MKTYHNSSFVVNPMQTAQPHRYSFHCIRLKIASLDWFTLPLRAHDMTGFVQGCLVTGSQMPSDSRGCCTMI